MKTFLPNIVLASVLLSGATQAETNTNGAPSNAMLDTYVISMCSSLATGLHLPLNYEQVEEVAGRAAQLLHPVTFNDEDKAGRASAFQMIDAEDTKEIDKAVEECAKEGYITLVS